MMDTIKSFKGYGKVDEIEQATFKKKLRNRIIIILISTVILVAIIATAITVTLTRTNSSSSSSLSSAPGILSSLKSVCSVTLYPDTCINSLSSLIVNNNTSKSYDPREVFSISLHVAKDGVIKLRNEFTFISKRNLNGAVLKAMQDCYDLLDENVDRLEESMSYVTLDDKNRIDDLRTWLSAALTNQETCLDNLSEINDTASLVDNLRDKMRNSTELISNSLAIASKVISVLGKFKIPFQKRKLLEENNVVADKVVAKDGSGDYTTISEAIKAVPLKSVKRLVIYVKEGVYIENVVVNKSVWNVMVYGDGMDKSIVSGSLNFIDGTPTFSTATFAVAGRGFIAKDMAFKNTAGAIKHQAVAFRSQSDRSIFYRCLFDGYQDTLYAHSFRQFYRDCTITGTIDFIFGNAAVVLQNCKIQPRQPLPNQFNTITAQGKKDPNQNTGISIQKCTISGLGQVNAPTYLGRPWQQYSTTLVMQSGIGPVLHQLGWVGWVNGVEPASTIYYAEYQNTGPGSDVSKRVKWVGYRPAITTDEASKFTVANFIDGTSWLGESNVAFDTTL